MIGGSDTGEMTAWDRSPTGAKSVLAGDDAQAFKRTSQSMAAVAQRTGRRTVSGRRPLQSLERSKECNQTTVKEFQRTKQSIKKAVLVSLEPQKDKDRQNADPFRQ